MAQELNWTVKLDEQDIPHPGGASEHPGEIALTGEPDCTVTHGWRVDSQNQNSPEGQGKVEKIALSKELDAATTSLLLACAAAWHIPMATITGWGTVANEHKPVFVMKLKDCGITDANLTGFTLCFTEIQWEYREYKTDGKLDGTAKVSYWSRSKGVGIKGEGIPAGGGAAAKS